ncbi:MAG TPA: glycosyltransferase [Thermoanaerobaculia bacterium]|nr:glycosyltransferase [Thermoanaerobaculia bacterium]
MSEGRPSKLVVLTHSLTGGGAERFASTLVRHLDRRRFHPSVLAATAERTYQVPADVPVSVLGYRGPLDLPRTVLATRRHLAELAPDLVLSNVLSTNCLAGGALWRRPEPPAWVARVGNAPELAEPWWQRLWAERVYPRARFVVSNSARMAEAVAREYPELAPRLRVLPNPTDFAALDSLAAAPPTHRRGEEEARLIWVGRLTPQKRPLLALEALARLRQEVDARLWLCGSGPLAEAVERQVEKLELGDAVEQLGFVANPFPLLAQADLFLLTSDFEGLPNALIEAQGLGVPALATSCPYGPDEIVEEGVTGRLVPPGQAGVLAWEARQLLADRPQLLEMGRAARERARRLFDLAAVLPRWQALLLEAVGESA